ncbi:BrxA family protein [Halorubrum trapanicum]|uniref:BrxA family protein n=1 Tax=Halorubrum trapanicum TaxID=29284 RepID=UPI000BBB0A9C|nr:BrxA family protein [Halorubrum trapanicum]
MTLRTDGRGASLPSLDSTFPHDEVSMALTRCGLLVDRAETLARLYAQHRDWTVVEEKWIQERFDERSTRGSSKGIYRALSSRFKTAGSELPSIVQLPSVLDQCETERDKAQVLYFYLLEDDPLVKYTVHRYVDRLQESGAEGLDFEQETIERLLNEFHYEDGSEFDYAESTTRRWGEGLRSVMREIGVLDTQQALHGQIPNLGTTPLLVASGYSWELHGDDWLSQPTGWHYLFQSVQYWDSLAERVSDDPNWGASGIHGELRLQPVDDTYDWAEPWEGEV